MLVGRDPYDDCAVREVWGIGLGSDDELWALIEPLLPPWPQKAPGPKPVDDRLCLQGILYVLSQRRQLATAAAGAGGRLRAHLLAPTRTVVRGRCLREAATASCSPSCTPPTNCTGPGPVWMLPTSARKKGARPPVRRRSTAGRRAVSTT
ncbi:transposase [Streptomyces swartbergensis]|uniref:transposase n=1 Tax=Streptomyces swartbergensis TaxID=487165 RepID=UPI0038062CD7